MAADPLCRALLVRAASADVAALAAMHFDAYLRVAQEGDYDARRPKERELSVIGAIGAYLFDRDFQLAIRRYDYPVPVARGGDGVGKTLNPWDGA